MSRATTVTLLASVATAVALAGCQPKEEGAISTAREWVCDGYVALTFDDGPSEYTDKVSDALVAEGMMATFFLIGDNVTARPESVSKLVGDGHEVASHTMTHPDLVESWHPSLSSDEIVAGAETIESSTGKHPRWFRPPYGSTNDGVRAAVEAAGMTEVIWTLDTFDWKGLSAQEIADTFDDVQSGDIVLMHDSSSESVDSIPLIADKLHGKGLCAGEITHSDVEVQIWDGLTHKVTASQPTEAG